ncbi:hypothetical protein Dsin_022141 [Dipteronia sinensis]|uniref:HAT C-terminal dimerisation domain-containing protein n=1 Tax=Dipteronia sinensis TaxID=43782 RepID=A0AAE0A2F3_9ROSI|nr:hypothetical protein Dsin_022141 [Dipteronia sinensis]
MDMSCFQAKSFFGIVQRIYKLFSGSTKQWEVLKNHVKYSDRKGLTLKSWSDTRWESRISSFKAIRFQAPQIKKALIHLMENTDDAATVSDAQSLVKCLKFDLLVGMVIWYEILYKVNKVSKVLQKKDMNIDDAISLLNGLITYFEEYREKGFEEAMIEAEKIAIEMEIKSKFHETRVRSKKKFFDEIASNEPIESMEEAFRVTYFLSIVDNAISSLKSRFEQFQIYGNTFGFLFNLSKLSSLDTESLKYSCDTLETFLQHGDNYDIDAVEFFSELQLLRKSLPEGTTKPNEVLEYIKNIHICFPNTWIAYRILLTIPVTVATAERSFSKLKLIKNYLRSTMLQDSLSGLASYLSKKKVLANLDGSSIISKFALQKARRIEI